MKEATTNEHLIRLDFVSNEELELPVVWFLAASWHALWDVRCKNKRPELYKMRADLEVKICLLRKTSMNNNTANIILNILERFI